MGPKSLQGSAELAVQIKRRRISLNMTIEEAAAKAGVGTKTWSRYESGKSIRQDKYKGICRALKWHSLPNGENAEDSNTFDIDSIKKDSAWSPYLAKRFGQSAALSFVLGSEILLDDIREDMEALSSKPKGTHIGEIDSSFLRFSLPAQFLLRYDYDFFYALHCTVKELRVRASRNHDFKAHSVLEELALYLIIESFRGSLECMDLHDEWDHEEHHGNWDGWIYDIFDDQDLLMYLYSNSYLNQKITYHFDYWMERQFYCD